MLCKEVVSILTETNLLFISAKVSGECYAHIFIPSSTQSNINSIPRKTPLLKLNQEVWLVRSGVVLGP